MDSNEGVTTPEVSSSVTGTVHGKLLNRVRSNLTLSTWKGKLAGAVKIMHLVLFKPIQLRFMFAKPFIMLLFVF